MSEPELTRPLHQRHDFGRLQERFRGHAPPQDAETSQRTLIDNGHIGSGIAGGSGSGITR
jgi:hypothetical protein